MATSGAVMKVKVVSQDKVVVLKQKIGQII
jgi:hypothetical protein